MWGSGVVIRHRKLWQHKPRRGQGNLPVKIEEKKKTGPKGKVGDGPVGWVRPLYAHNENDCLMWCSSPSLVVVVGKKGGIHYVHDLPPESFLQQMQLDDSLATHA